MGKDSKLKIEVEVVKDPSLRDQIERERVPEAHDTMDEDLLAYVNSFMDEYRSMPFLDEIDLTTVEGAQKAVKMLDRRKHDLDSQIKTARALRGLLLQKRG